MGERRFARARNGAAAHDRHMRGAVVGRAERRHGYDHIAQHTRDRVDGGRFKRFLETEWWQNAAQRPCKHRLAGTGRSIEHDVMASCRSYLKPPFGGFLAAHVAEVGVLAVRSLTEGCWFLRNERCAWPRAAFVEVRHDRTERCGRKHGQSLDERCFGGVLDRHDQCMKAALTGATCER